MDALDRLAAPAAGLLARVDAALARAGAPPDHPVWPLLRRLRALPGEAVAAFAAASPAPLAAAGSVLDRLSEEYAHTSAALPARAGWQGAGAESFGVQWSALRCHLGQDLTGRMRSTASYVKDVEGWMRDAREALADTLATILASAEAVRVRTEPAPDERERPAALVVPPDVARAAADIAARVLEPLAEAQDRGEALLGEWSGRLDRVSYHAPTAAAPADFDATTEVAY